ncbi:MAG: copper-binding protein [Parvularculaceae bacterium]
MKKSLLKLAALPLLAVAISPAFAAQEHDGMDHGKMDHGAMEGHDASCGLPMGEGVVKAVDVKGSKVNLTHKPIAMLEWPEMTMDFAVEKPVDLSAFASGENVHFLLKEGKKKDYLIAAMCSLDVADGAHEACMAQMHKVAMTVAEDAGLTCDMGEMDHDAHGDKESTPSIGSHEGHH